MRKKLLLIGLVLALLTGAILFGSLVYMTNMVLPGGSIEELTALRPEVLYRATDKRYSGSIESTASQYIEALAADDPLHDILGGFFWNEEGEDEFVLFYVTEPTEQLRERLQQKPELEYYEVALAKCDFTLQQLQEAQETLDAYLETAPLSVKNSVQISLLLPRENRIAVYVKNWSAFDQLNLARAMGPMVQRLFIVRENLNRMLPQMEFIHYDDWIGLDGEKMNWTTPALNGSREEIPAKERWAAYDKAKRIRDEYTDHIEYCTGWKNWRYSGLYLDIRNAHCFGALMLGSQMKIYTGDGILNDLLGWRPANWSPDESYAFYDSWGKQQEYLTKAIFREMADFQYPIVVVHSY